MKSPLLRFLSVSSRKSHQQNNQLGICLISLASLLLGFVYCGLARGELGFSLLMISTFCGFWVYREGLYACVRPKKARWAIQSQRKV